MIRRPPRSTLFLHDALPICFLTRERKHMQILNETEVARAPPASIGAAPPSCIGAFRPLRLDRKSTRLYSSHPSNLYALFFFKKKASSTHTASTLLPRLTASG